MQERNKEALFVIGPRNSPSDDSSQLHPVDEVIKFQLQESPDEFM